MDVAICECVRTGIRITVDVAHLPAGAMEGDVIRPEGDRFILDEPQTQARREQISARLGNLFDEGN